MQTSPHMKRIVGIGVLLVVLASSTAACVVGRHGHIAFVPPPALLVAAVAIAATARPGYVWVEGHWDWIGDHWVWHAGEWIAERPGFVWEQGLWIRVDGGRYHYEPGQWRAGPRVEVRDHR